MINEKKKSKELEIKPNEARTQGYQIQRLPAMVREKSQFFLVISNRLSGNNYDSSIY